MDIEKQIEWLKPERILKLYGGEKSIFGTKRLFIIGVGRNGTDCLLRAKSIAEERFSAEKSKIRFLAIGEDVLLEKAEYRGCVLSGGETLKIVPDDAIYGYLNDPEALSKYAREWFDEGLKNYTPAKPAYGLQKRQCGRIALFHCFNALIKILSGAISDFSREELPLEIYVTGNMGDAFFGGMAIDLGYILTSLFDTVNYPVKVNALMFAGDTAQMLGLDGRDLGNYYANTIVTKGEMDKFQCQKTPFSQKYTDSFEISSEKPPFNACFIASAEESYEKTLEKSAHLLVSMAGILVSKDDDADKMMSYNMFGKDVSHAFRYLAFDVSSKEIPLGKLLSYLAVKVFKVFNNVLNQNSVGEMQLGKFCSMVTPDAMLLATKAGDIPKIEYSGKLNPLFSVKSLKNGGEATKNYVEERLGEFAQLCKSGAELHLSEVVEYVVSKCEEAKNDIEKGPFYAIEIVRKCLSELRSVTDKINKETADIGDMMAREERLVAEAYRRVKSSPALFAGKAAEDYAQTLDEYCAYRRKQLTNDTVKEFYGKVRDELERYYKETLRRKTEIFDRVARDGAPLSEGFEPCGFDAFDVFDPKICEKLDKLVEELPESTRSLAFKRSRLLNIPDDAEEQEFARELAALAEQCFGSFLTMSYDEFCGFFEVESTVGEAALACMERASVKTPVSDDFPLTRIICPQNTDPGDVAPLRAVRKDINYIWNGSTLLHTVIVVQIKGGVKLDGFKDYSQWENMRYAYVNDSLKKHGIHIFSGQPKNPPEERA